MAVADWSSVDDPRVLLELPTEELWTIPTVDVEAFRLRAAQRLFAELRPRISFLDKLATNQKIDDVQELDDVVPLLFAHTAYKSYPMALLERSDFSRLTRWLAQLTAHDLSGVDASGVELIEDWVRLLDEQTPLRLATSSATSGKISFLPRSLDEMPAYHEAYRNLFLGFGAEEGIDLNDCRLTLINFSYRHGFNTNHRRLDELITTVAGGSEDRCYALYPGWLSPDMMSLAGRMAAAEAKGTRASISGALMARREEFLEFQRNRTGYLTQFVERLHDEVKGEQVLTLGGWTSIIDAVLLGEKLGIDGMFSPDSIVSTGGGLKGRVDVPDDYKERALRFFGVPVVHDIYGMTEQTAYMHLCGAGRYHVPPFMLPYVLDPDSGQPYPRSGVRTGRFAFLDLFPTTYWGGFITGDEVTVDWDGPCACGRVGASVAPTITRFSATRGGDDRISCAGVPDAYDRALRYMLDGM